MQRGRLVNWLVRLYLLLVVWTLVVVEVLGFVVGLDRVIHAPGAVVAQTEAEVHAPIAGTVSQVLVKNGQRVTKGQLLVRFEDAALRKRVARLAEQVAQQVKTVSTLKDEHAAATEGWGHKIAEAEAQVPTRELETHRRTREVMTLQWEARLAEARAQLAVSQAQREQAERGLARKSVPGLSGVISAGDVEELRDLVDVAKTRVALEERRVGRLEAERAVALDQHRAEEQALESLVALRERSVERLKAEARVAELDRTSQLRDRQQELEELELRLAAEEEVLRKGEVRAPWDATVIVDTEEGDNVMHGQRLLLLASGDDVRFRARADEAFVADLAVGQSVSVRMDGFPYIVYGAFEGTVEALGSRAEVDRDGKAAIEVVIRLTDPRRPGSEEEFLLPHLTGVAEVTVEEDVPALLLLMRQMYR